MTRDERDVLADRIEQWPPTKDWRAYDYADRLFADLDAAGYSIVPHTWSPPSHVQRHVDALREVCAAADERGRAVWPTEHADAVRRCANALVAARSLLDEYDAEWAQAKADAAKAKS